MLEDLFSDARTITRLRDSMFGPCIDEYFEGLRTRGFARQSIWMSVRTVRKFGCWLVENEIPISAISETTIAQFGKAQSQPDWVRRGGAAALRRLLELLRSDGRVPEPTTPEVLTPAQHLGWEFARHLNEDRALSAATVSNYCPEAVRFLSERFGAGVLDLPTICVEDIRSYVERHAPNYSAKRIQLILTALRSFLRFLYLRHKIPLPLADHVPTAPNWHRAQPPKWVSAEEIAKVIDTCNRHAATGLRDYAILLLLARLGLRAGEIVSLELEDICWETGELSVCGKGQQRKRFPIPEDVGQALTSYLKNARPPCDSRRVFLRARAPYRGLGHSSTVATIARRAILRAGLDPPLKGAHLFRHSLATTMLRKGATLTEIGQILHHASPDTTSIYAKVDITGLRTLALPWPGDRS